MCFVGFCFCDTCNSYNSKCVEFFILIVSLLSFIVSILGFLFINKEHLTVLCIILLIVLLFLSFIILLSICLILIFRYKQTINNTHNKAALAFSILGLIMTITFFIATISEISQIHIHYQEINHPCSSKESNINYINSKDNQEQERIKQFCLHNGNKNAHIISTKEFLIAYAFAVSLLILMLSLIYSWFNEYRRIKYLIDGSLYDFKIKENKKEQNDFEEDDESNNNEEKDEKNKKSNNGVGVNIKNGNKKNELKKINDKNTVDEQNLQNGISIYVSKNNTNKSLVASSELMLTGNNAEKIKIKKKK